MFRQKEVESCFKDPLHYSMQFIGAEVLSPYLLSDLKINIAVLVRRTILMSFTFIKKEISQVSMKRTSREHKKTIN